jgi:alcohol dehydrogenase class IV
MSTSSSVRPLETSIDQRYLQDRGCFRFSAPRQIVYGRGAALAIADELNDDQLKRVLLLTDKNLRVAGVVDGILESLEARGNVTVYERSPGEPTISEVGQITEAARAADATSIVAVGGGATMDTSKCVRLLIDRGGTVRDALAAHPRTFAPSNILLVTVATTAGTGAESVGAALMIDDETREKVALSSDVMNPDVAVVDPDLTLSVPGTVTASTGADALAQAIGPFIGPLRHPVTDALAGEAIRLITANLPKAVQAGDDLEARAAVAYGSLMSGLAMRNTEAMADQFFDEVLGPRYGIPHGTVAGIVLPYVMQFNRIEATPQIARIAPLIVVDPADSEEERVDQVIARFSALSEEIGLPRLADLGVSADDLPELARLTSKHPGVDMGINPGLITEDVALTILHAAFKGVDPLETEI